MYLFLKFGCRCLPSINPLTSTCKIGEVCETGLCVKTCQSQADCGCGHTCASGKCLQTCLSPRDCNNGLNCVSGLCTGGCLTDLECPSSEACINGQCGDPCQISSCGPNAICKTSGHLPVCLCPKGFLRDIRTGGCLKAQCVTNNECPMDKVCSGSQCVNPCSAPGTCGVNAQCSVRNHQAFCQVGSLAPLVSGGFIHFTIKDQCKKCGCITWSWQFPGTSAPSTTNLTVS